MADFPRYTTLSQEEKARIVGTTGPGKKPILKTHSFPVPFPDGTEGTCSYERLGPAYHRFDYRYADGAAMPRQYHTRPLPTIDDVVQVGLEFSIRVFQEAMEVERRDYFARISPPTDGSRVPNPNKFRMEAGRAKEIGGKYALCLPFPSGKRYVRASDPVRTFEEAEELWRTRRDDRFVIACCNRMDRCWELLKYNPLKKEGHPVR
jgi:hypothetical protein